MVEACVAYVGDGIWTRDYGARSGRHYDGANARERWSGSNVGGVLFRTVCRKVQAPRSLTWVGARTRPHCDLAVMSIRILDCTNWHKLGRERKEINNDNALNARHRTRKYIEQADVASSHKVQTEFNT